MHRSALHRCRPRRGLALAGTLLLCGVAGGCRRSPQTSPSHPPGQTSTAQSKLAAYTDEALVHLNSKDGIGAALRVPNAVVRAGQTIPIHFALEDFGALKPLNATVCDGLFVSMRERGTERVVVANPQLPQCAEADFADPAPAPLPVGKLFVFDTDLATAIREPIVPGIYQVSVSWGPRLNRHTSPDESNEAKLFPAPYTAVMSNVVDLVVTP